MESNQITPFEIYKELKNLEKALQRKGIISTKELTENREIIWDWPSKIMMLADEELLGEDWNSKEDNEAWKDL